MRTLAVAVATLAILAGCTRHKPPAVDLRAVAAEDLGRADVRLLDGCYACLVEARDIYARLATGPVSAQATVRRFEAELLIVLREKELAIDTTASQARLQAAGDALGPEFDVPRILTRVDVLPPLASGIGEAEYAAFRRRHLEAVRTETDDLAWLATAPLFAPVRDYLTLTIRCGPNANSSAAPDDSPLVAYRRATCAGNRGFPVLEGLHDTHTAFAEVAFTLARSAPSGKGSTTTRVRGLVTEAYKALPQSPAVTYLTGTVNHLLGNCREAVRLYDETLVMQDRHENAQLGRTVCLTYLHRPDEAIEAATRLISWQSSNLREAYYWRAYNYWLQHALDRARPDVTESKRLGLTIENLTLAGIVEYEQSDLELASQDLQRAWTTSQGQACSAAWYQGLVHIKRDAWGDAGTGFEHAMTCYAANVREDRAGLAAMETQADLDPTFRAAQVENFKLAIVEDERQRHAAAMNVATSYANTGDGPKATAFLAIAAEDPDLAESIAALQKFLVENVLPPVARPNP